jgi:hypothetical protein
VAAVCLGLQLIAADSKSFSVHALLLNRDR